VRVVELEYMYMDRAFSRVALLKSSAAHGDSVRLVCSTTYMNRPITFTSTNTNGDAKTAMFVGDCPQLEVRWFLVSD
jgi:hypothetical protein